MDHIKLNYLMVLKSVKRKKHTKPYIFSFSSYKTGLIIFCLKNTGSKARLNLELCVEKNVWLYVSVSVNFCDYNHKIWPRMNAVIPGHKQMGGHGLFIGGPLL